MGACHSCIAGPAVCSTLSLSRLLDGRHRPCSSMGHQHHACRRGLLAERGGWGLHSVRARGPVGRRVAVVGARGPPVSVEPLAKSRVREVDAERKPSSCSRGP